MPMQSKYEGSCKDGCGATWGIGTTIFKDSLTSHWCSNAQCASARNTTNAQEPAQPQKQAVTSFSFANLQKDWEVAYSIATEIVIGIYETSGGDKRKDAMILAQVFLKCKYGVS